MQITPTRIPEVKIIESDLFTDERGYFTRLFRDTELENYPIKEVNRSMSVMAGTIRGLHMQTEPMAQDKLVQCLQGEIFDVAVDMRPDSPTYLQWVGVNLKENRMLLVPKGFAHGFQTLQNYTTVQYFVSNYFSPEHERGFRYNDPKIGIEWKDIDQKQLKGFSPELRNISEKDQNWALL